MPLAPLQEPYASDPELLLALCIWREARGCSPLAKLGVAWTIRNRCMFAPREGFAHDIRGNVLKPWAFSSFMQGDPNSLKYPSDTDPSWKESLEAAHSITQDPTETAVFYYSRPLVAPPKAWGDVIPTVVLSGLHFFRLSK